LHTWALETTGICCLDSVWSLEHACDLDNFFNRKVGIIVDSGIEFSF
jgi:hypothetical protein